MILKRLAGQVLERTGLLGRVKVGVERSRQVRLPDYFDVSIHENTVRFHIETTMEYRHFSRLSERKVIKKTLEQVSSDSVFWDVGSAMGLYSCIIANHYPMATILSFEPHPGRYLRVLENANENKLENIYGYNTSLSDTDGKFEMRAHRREPNTSRLVSAFEGNIISQKTTGSSLVNGEAPTPSVMKIDVEGEEYKVLAGMGDALENVESLIVEIHPSMLDVDTKEVNTLLTKYGFDIERISERGGQYHILATKD